MARRKPVAWLAILLLVALAGCTGAESGMSGESLSIVGEPAPVVAEPTHPTGAGPTPSPAWPILSPDPVARPPALLSRMLYRAAATVDQVVDGVTAISLEPWQEAMAVGTGDVRLTWQLDTHDASAFAHLLRTSGATPDYVRTVMGAIEVGFAAPNPPTWEVWLDGIRGSRLSLTRQAEPTVVVGYRTAEGDLVPIEGHEAVIPAGRLELVLQFDQPVSRQSASAWREHLVEGAGAPVTLRWTAENELRLEMSAAVTRLEVDPHWVLSATSGLPVSRYPITLWNQEELPYLERVSLDTGEAERLYTLPPDITEVQPSPGGRWIALRAWERQGGALRASRVEVLDLVQNEVVRAPLDGHELRWAGDRLANLRPLWIDRAGWETWDPLTGEEPEYRAEQIASAAFSPDGGWVAWVQGGESGQPSDYTSFGWNALQLWEPSSDRHLAVEEFVRAWWFGKDGDFRQWVAWSPDGGLIAALDPVERSGLSDLVIYDLDLGERRVVRAGIPVSPWGRTLTWSPDGSHVLAASGGAPVTIIPLDDSPVITLEEAWHGQAYWSGTGGMLLAADGPWRGVHVYDFADGSRVDLGDGLPAGWSGDNAVYVIRWPGSEARYWPNGL